MTKQFERIQADLKTVQVQIKILIGEKNPGKGGKSLGASLAADEKEKKGDSKGTNELKIRMDKLESDVRIMNTCITVINKNLNGAGAKPAGRPKGKSLADALTQDTQGTNEESGGLPQLKIPAQSRETNLSPSKRGNSLASMKNGNSL